MITSLYSSFLREIGRSPHPPLNSITLISSSWVKFNLAGGDLAMKQFAENLKKVKRATMDWAKEKATKEKEELLKVEEEISRLLNSKINEVFSNEELLTLKSLEESKCALLEKEDMWRLKSRALWLAKGDNKTKFFQ